MTLLEALKHPNLLYVRASMMAGKVWGYDVIHTDPLSPSGKSRVSGGRADVVEPLLKELGLDRYVVSPTEHLGVE